MKQEHNSLNEFIETVTELFVPFNGYYEKKYYDIQLPDWTIIKKCWPNAWTIWLRTGKQYWPWECLFRLSKIDWNPNQNISIDSIRIGVISSINTILNKFDDDKTKKYVIELLHLATIEDVEVLRMIINNSNKENLALFCRNLLDWVNIESDIRIIIMFAGILRDWNPQIIKEIFNKSRSRWEIFEKLIKW